jgi:hypothetical protein
MDANEVILGGEQRDRERVVADRPRTPWRNRYRGRDRAGVCGVPSFAVPAAPTVGFVGDPIDRLSFREEAAHLLGLSFGPCDKHTPSDSRLQVHRTKGWAGLAHGCNMTLSRHDA